MGNLLARLAAFLRTAIIKPLADASITADPSAMYGLIAMQTNLNAYACREKASITTAGTASTLTALQAHRSVILLEAGASGGFTLTTPTAANIIKGFPSTIPLDGTYAKRIRIVNNSVGQTATLTAGDSSVTITGTATIATATAREYLLTVLSATTVSYENLGTATL